MAVLLILAAVICFVISTLLLFGVFSGAHALGWLSLGLLLWACYVLVTGAGAVVERIRQ